MIPVYAEEISQLIDGLDNIISGRLDANTCIPFLEAARERHLTSHESAVLLSLVVHEDDGLYSSSMELIELIKKRGNNFQDLNNALKNKNLDYIISSGRQLQELSFQIIALASTIEKEKDGLPKYSSFPFLDEFIKIGLAVYEGLHPHEILFNQFQELVNFRATLTEKSNEFLFLYPAHWGYVLRFKQVIKLLEDGAGAIYYFTESSYSRRSSLLEGLMILSKASASLSEIFNIMKAIHQEECYSAIPAFDAFIKTIRRKIHPENYPKNYNGTLLKTLQDAVSQMESFLQEESEECLSFMDTFFLHPNTKEEWETVISPSFEKLKNNLRKILEKPEESLTLFIREGEEVLKQKQAWMKKTFTERNTPMEPLWEEVREAVKGFYYGVTPKFIALSKLKQANAAVFTALEQLADISEEKSIELANAANYIAASFKNLEDAVNSNDFIAFPELIAVIEEKNKEWNDLQCVLFNMLTDKKSCICIKCSFKNPSESRFCRQCNQRMHFSGIQEEIYKIEIIEGRN